MTFFDYFDRAYVINLPNRVDRRRYCEAELERAGLPVTPGKVEMFAGVRPEEAEPFRSVGVKGCYLSHLGVLRRARDEGLRSVLVLEDDVLFSPSFKRNEEKLVQTLQSVKWDLVQFGYLGTRTHVDEAVVRLDVFKEENIGSHFYAVHQSCLERLIRFLEGSLARPPGHPGGSPIPLDGSLNIFRLKNPDVISRIAVPSMGFQRSSASDVTPGYLDRAPITRALKNLGRRLGVPKVAKWVRRSEPPLEHREDG